MLDINAITSQWVSSDPNGNISKYFFLINPLKKSSECKPKYHFASVHMGLKISREVSTSQEYDDNKN